MQKINKTNSVKMQVLCGFCFLSLHHKYGVTKVSSSFFLNNVFQFIQQNDNIILVNCSFFHKTLQKLFGERRIVS